MFNYRKFQIGASLILILNTAYLFFNQPDWWIYGLISGSGGVLNLINQTNCSYWRFAVSAIIVLGTLETLFLAWTLRLLEQTFSLGDKNKVFDKLPEGRNLILVACATFLTISARLKNSHHQQLLDYIRTLVVSLLALMIASVIGYSTLYYFSLDDFVTRHLTN